MLIDINFCKHATKIKENYLDRHQGTQSELIYVSIVGEIVGLTTIYLRKAKVY